jgi:hypothetical protein
MEIATLLNVHGNSQVVMDTIDSIKMYMTNNILVLTDGAAHWKSKSIRGKAEVLARTDPFVDMLPTYQVEGFYHGRSKSPYRNLTLGLKTLGETWKADWYCYIEYDCLIASADFKEDLEEAAHRGVWMIGNDHRWSNYDLPLVEKIVGPLKETRILLGCCVFFHRKFMESLREIDFFTRFLHLTNPFQESVPGFDEQGAYDIGEIIYPTLAVHLGGKVEQFAHFNDQIGWSGDAERYPMRFRPEIGSNGDPEFPDASIIHPLKTYNHPLRDYYRERRKRQRNWKTFSIHQAS